MTSKPTSNTSVQRKQGVGLFKPVSWNRGRRVTSPLLGVAERSVSGGQILNCEGPLLQLQIEAFLDDHPDFTDSYVLRKVKKSTIDKWLIQNTHKDEEDHLPIRLAVNTVEQNNSEDTFQTNEGSQRKPYCSKSAECTPVVKRSTSLTPHRKISSATFEGGRHSPLLTTAEDGSMSFLTVPPNVRKRSKNLQPEFLNDDSNNSKSLSNIPDIHENLTSDLNHPSLCFKIAKNICLFSKSLSTSILEVKQNGQKICLVSSAVNVNLTSTDDESFENNLTLDPELNTYLAQLAHEGKSMLFTRKEVQTNLLGVSFLPDEYEEVAILLLPDVDGEVQGLALLSLGSDCVKYILENKLISDICKLSGICMKNASDFQTLSLEVTRSQVFLDLARVMFENQTSIEYTVLKILANLLVLIECERAQILLLSKDSSSIFRKVYDLDENDMLKEEFNTLMRPFEDRFPNNSSITGLVAAIGKTVNIKDILIDPRFDINDDDDFEHRSLLCMPIRDSGNQIIGVVSLVNKKKGYFTSNDESFVEAFGIFCGISLANVSNYEQAKAAEARSQVALDIMTYHASSNTADANSLASKVVPSSLSLHLQSFSFTDCELEDMDTLMGSLRMFYDLDLVKKFKLNHKTMCQWILTVKKNYRPEVVYHNWRHAFNVAQVMFSSLINSGWWEGLGPITCLGLLVACLCHDLDHRGTNNSYQMATNSPLAKLYSTSTLERHHLNQALIILNLDGNRILDSLSPAEYTAVLSVIEEAILATDLSLHFAHLGRLKNLSKDGPAGLDWENQEKVSITMAALMTASDLGASTKPFQVQRKIAGMVAEEFWYQGDLEKAQLNTPPVPMMDRELRHELPKLQVGFCEGVCLPVYRALACLSPALQPMEEAVIFNRDRWAELAENNQEEEEEKENKVTRNL
eukprot:GFUD01094260.1.p1 GENE.GFUD01094260.1~~GFUD01094260.1.p1  ORF type:complete len:916 (+),score=231.39 GFUD01094260.1:166-2913(+)